MHVIQHGGSAELCSHQLHQVTIQKIKPFHNYHSAIFVGPHRAHGKRALNKEHLLQCAHKKGAQSKPHATVSVQVCLSPLFREIPIVYNNHHKQYIIET